MGSGRSEGERHHVGKSHTGRTQDHVSKSFRKVLLQWKPKVEATADEVAALRELLNHPVDPYDASSEEGVPQLAQSLPTQRSHRSNDPVDEEEHDWKQGERIGEASKPGPDQHASYRGGS